MTRGLMLLAGATVVAVVALPCATLAEEKPERKPWNRWAIAPGVTSANLAHTPWVLVQSTGLSWPDGRQAVVTFWATPERASGGAFALYIRCTAYFDRDMIQTGEKCEQPAE